MGDTYTWTKFCSQHKLQPCPLWTTISMCWPWGNISQKILAQWCWSLVNHSQFSATANQLHLSQWWKQRFHFNGVDLLLIIAHSSVPTDQKPQILNSKYHLKSPGRFFASSWNFISQVSILHCSQYYLPRCHRTSHQALSINEFFLAKVLLAYCP